MGGNSSKPVAASEAEDKHPAAPLTPFGAATTEGKGTLGAVLPVPLIQGLPLSSRELWQLSSTSRFFRNILQVPRTTALAHQASLRCLLRLEKTEFPPFSLSETKKADVECITRLLDAYEGYFSVFKTMRQRYADNGHENWSNNRELDEKRKHVKTAEQDLPSGLIQGTAVGILQATVSYLQAFAEMAATGGFNYPRLDRLGVKGVGGAQRDAGPAIWDCYFRGESMKGTSDRTDYSWAANLGRSLGRDFFLCSRERGRRAGFRPKRFYGGWLGAWNLTLASNSISLIKVMTERLGSLSAELRDGETLPSASPV